MDSSAHRSATGPAWDGCLRMTAIGRAKLFRKSGSSTRRLCMRSSWRLESFIAIILSSSGYLTWIILPGPERRMLAMMGTRGQIVVIDPKTELAKLWCRPPFARTSSSRGQKSLHFGVASCAHSDRTEEPQRRKRRAGVISRRTSGDFRKWHEAAEPGRHL